MIGITLLMSQFHFFQKYTNGLVQIYLLENKNEGGWLKDKLEDGYFPRWNLNVSYPVSIRDLSKKKKKTSNHPRIIVLHLK